MLARSEAATGHELPVDLGALAADCLTDLGARARENDVELRTDVRAAWTRGDPALLERMIANLIDNGIRHNEPGGHLTVRTGSDAHGARVLVANGGAVIDPAEARMLVEPFRRLDRGPGGFGLGLSIVRSVVTAHGGRLEVAAPASGGLEITVRLEAIPAPHVGVVLAPPALTES
jgi:signal transduction histidine kinase